MGGGRKKFLPQNGSTHGVGKRRDVDLVEEWLKDKKMRNANSKYISNVEELKNVDPATTDYLLGKLLYLEYCKNFHTMMEDL